MKFLSQCFTALCFVLITTASVAAHLNGTWIYDAKDATQPTQAKAVINFDKLATAEHQINQLFTYGSDMEMYCPEGHAGCAPDDMNQFVYYNVKPKVGLDGQERAAKYLQAFTAANVKVTMFPVIDGRTDDGYLKQFNQLSQAKAEQFADKVAQQVCTDDNVSGIQFDIEPFDLSDKAGEYYFYKRISTDFGSKLYNCIDQAHPTGRMFSVFAFAKDLNDNVADIFGNNPRAIFIDSLYDLGPNPGGVPNTPGNYAAYALAELNTLNIASDQYNIKFQLAIPASASAHEFETYTKNGHVTRGAAAQQDYLAVLYGAIGKSGIKNNTHYLGTNVWDWSSTNNWGGGALTPVLPSPTSQAFLELNL